MENKRVEKSKRVEETSGVAERVANYLASSESFDCFKNVDKKARDIHEIMRVFDDIANYVSSTNKDRKSIIKDRKSEDFSDLEKALGIKQESYKERYYVLLEVLGTYYDKCREYEKLI